MTCALVRRRLSEWLDGELEPRLTCRIEAHLSQCRACAERADGLRMVGRMLGELPRLESPEPVAARVFDRIEIETETRRPALVSLFRGFSAARPFILPSLVPAALVLASVLSGVLALDPGPLPVVHPAPGAWWATPASGTESNPLFPSAGLDLPRERTSVELPAAVLARQGKGEGTFFLETVVARDGSVAGVTVLDGDTEGQSALVDALRRQRFEPVQYRGRPVAVSVYRLISRMEVRSPLT
jgi:hypothetical protein